MATSISIGLSVLSDSFTAGQCAAELAFRDTPEQSNCLAVVFATETYDHAQMLRGIKSRITTENIVGFTVAGIFDAQQLATEGVIIGLIQSDTIDFMPAVAENLSQDQYAAGIALSEHFGQPLAADGRYALQLLFPDGISNTVSSMLDALFSNLGKRTQYAGGGSGDNLHFLNTSQYLNDKVFKDAAVAALIRSDKPLGVAISHGWEPTSPPMIVTSSSGNRINELDWQSAIEVYADFAREHAGIEIDDQGFAKFAMKHPFGIPQAQEGDGYIVRDPISKAEDGSITCVGDIPENSVLRILDGDRASLLKAVKEATISAKEQLRGNPVAGVLVFTCVSRCVLLKESFFDEIKAVREIIGEDVPIFGCMSFGEIGSIGEGPPEFHNKSVVICAFPE